MNNYQQNKKQDQKSRKVRASLVYKLNSRLLLRMLGIFVATDLFLCVAFGTVTLLRTEKTLAQAVEIVAEYGMPSQQNDPWAQISGYRLERLLRNPQGYVLPEGFRPFAPEETRDGARNYRLDADESLPLRERITSLVYEYEFISGNQTYRVSVDMGPSVIGLKQIMTALLLLQIVLLLGTVFSGAQVIRKTLQPIVALAETARTLNLAGSDFDAEKMEDLAIKLNAINAAKLDTRISVDETERELQGLAAAINSMLDRINDSYRSQIRFVSDASHELRTPISVIEGYANLLDRWGKSDEKTLDESIKAIKEEAANMKGLVEQLLFLARGDSNTMHLQPETFDLSVLAAEVLRETQMIDSGHEFVSNVRNASIYADKALIKQALRILIDNAIKYSNAGGTITLSVSEKGEQIHLTVQDEGIGIPPEAVSRVFDRFYRADESRAKSTGGTGLGLSIARWIAERHGGHMEVLSRQDIGTRVSIVIPKTIPAAASEKGESKA